MFLGLSSPQKGLVSWDNGVFQHICLFSATTGEYGMASELEPWRYS